MKKESDVRVCKNKKCQKVLTAGYKHRYCEACRNKHAQTAKKCSERYRRWSSDCSKCCCRCCYWWKD